MWASGHTRGLHPFLQVCCLVAHCTVHLYALNTVCVCVCVSHAADVPLALSVPPSVMFSQMPLRVCLCLCWYVCVCVCLIPCSSLCVLACMFVYVYLAGAIAGLFAAWLVYKLRNGDMIPFTQWDQQFVLQMVELNVLLSVPLLSVPLHCLMISN